MSEQTFSSLEFFEKKAGLKKDAKAERKAALKTYFGKGGIIRVDLDKKTAAGWPVLVYPTKLRLRALIREKERVRAVYLKKKKAWEKKLRDAELYNLSTFARQFSSPLYWKHFLQMMRDPDYRADAEKTRLPMHLVSDPRWKPMIRMFIEDLEYRKQLTETVENSIVYKKNKKLARYASQLAEFRKSESNKNIADLDKKIRDIEESLDSYRKLVEWANE
ncbi:MAG: hypothetical protein QXK06_01020 [Candidatus Diapherotrites archaeon]